MLNPVLNIFLPIIILLTLSSEDRLGPIPALLLAVGIPATYGIFSLVRSRNVNASSIMGIVSVLLTGIIAVFKLDTELFAVKEAALPVGFSALLLISNRTSFPIVKLLFDMVQRKHDVEREVQAMNGERAYRKHIERSGMIWAGIMTISGIMKFALSSFIVSAPAGSEKFNTQLATYELAQIPTSMMVTMVMILSLIWYIGKSTGQIIDLPPSEVLRGGERISRIFGKFSRFSRARHQSAWSESHKKYL